MASKTIAVLALICLVSAAQAQSECLCVAQVIEAHLRGLSSPCGPEMLSFVLSTDLRKTAPDPRVRMRLAAGIVHALERL